MGKVAMKMQEEVQRAENMVRDRDSPFFPKGYRIPDMAQVDQEYENKGEVYIVHTTITHPDGRRQKIAHEVAAELVDAAMGDTVRKQQRKLMGRLAKEAGKAMVRGIGNVIY